jgi:hypothetical protein
MGLEGSVVDGMVTKVRAAMKCFLLGLHEVVWMKSSWRYRWEQERSPDWWSNGQPFVHGSVLVERHVSKPNEWVPGGAIALWSS